MRLHCQPRCPSRHRGGPRARPAGTRGSTGPGGRGGLACARRAVRPARRRGPGAPRLSRAGLGSPRGDGAPERALFALWPHCALPSSPPVAPPEAPRPGPVCFSSPAPSTPTRKQPSGLRQRPEAVAQGRPESKWGSTASPGPAGSGVRGEGAPGPSWRERGRRMPVGRWPNRAHGLGGLRRPEAWARKDAGGLRCCPCPAAVPGPQPQPDRGGAAEWG
ncbi:collagen alpha-1(I) chain-like [Sapajus apella]|uniref:Collagen alpha-1(I) chain-like n=1 Tax=Sapajus apella TaxID=9515 RepID=A0A6J3EKZ5_SAPAP|nr:collagen alpha-1(I) chain-like [Sapajus apella]XP_032095344.1 collagen alpha-1(I) chain-like [Sapajus apella]